MCVCVCVYACVCAVCVVIVCVSVYLLSLLFTSASDYQEWSDAMFVLLEDRLFVHNVQRANELTGTRTQPNYQQQNTYP